MKVEENKKVTRTEMSTTIDKTTGEVLTEIKNETFQVDREPDYVKLYIRDIGKLKNFTAKQNDVLIAFLGHIGYSNIIPAYKPIKQKIANDLNISLNTVNKAVNEFSKKGIFISVARGMYMADPNLFGRGKWSDIKSLRLVIEYKPDGTKILSSDLPEQMKLNFGL